MGVECCGKGECVTPLRNFTVRSGEVECVKFDHHKANFCVYSGGRAKYQLCRGMKKHPNVMRFLVAFGIQVLVFILDGLVESGVFGKPNGDWDNGISVVVMLAPIAAYYYWLSLFLPNNSGGSLARFARWVGIALCSAAITWALVIPTLEISRLFVGRR
ncbi:MAG: hypothetical protein JWO95_739 [Verrucomicrobiales bacterium]|nr:hypothetical protein [Verrucomicrobiales bacterium]